MLSRLRCLLPKLWVSSVDSVYDLDSFRIDYRDLMRPDPYEGSMLFMEPDARRWHVLPPYNDEAPDAGDAGEPRNGDVVKAATVSDEKDIENEDSKQDKILMRLQVFKQSMDYRL